MLPNIIIGRYRKDSELVDWSYHKTIETKQLGSVTHRKSNSDRYNKYEEETDPIDRLKKLKDFLCSDNDEGPIQALVCLKPTVKEKEKENDGHEITRRQKESSQKPAFILRDHSVNTISRQRMRLKELILPPKIRQHTQKQSSPPKLTDRIKFFKIL